jgi:hypothetical protein
LQGKREKETRSLKINSREKERREKETRSLKSNSVFK